MRFWGFFQVHEIGWCWMHFQAWIQWQGILLQSQISLFLCILKREAHAQKLVRSKTPAQLHIMKWHPDYIYNYIYNKVWQRSLRLSSRWRSKPTRSWWKKMRQRDRGQRRLNQETYQWREALWPTTAPPPSRLLSRPAVHDFYVWQPRALSPLGQWCARTSFEVAQSSLAQWRVCIRMEGQRSCIGSCKWTVRPAGCIPFFLDYLIEFPSWGQPDMLTKEIKIQDFACGICRSCGRMDWLRWLLPDVPHSWFSRNLCFQVYTLELSWFQWGGVQLPHLWSHCDFEFFKWHGCTRLESAPYLGRRDIWPSTIRRTPRWWRRWAGSLCHIILSWPWIAPASWHSQTSSLRQWCLSMGKGCVSDLGRSHWCINPIWCDFGAAGDTTSRIPGCDCDSNCSPKSYFRESGGFDHYSSHRRSNYQILWVCSFFPQTRWFCTSSTGCADLDTLPGKSHARFWTLHSTFWTSSTSGGRSTSISPRYWTADYSSTCPQWWGAWTESWTSSSTTTPPPSTTHMESTWWRWRPGVNTS